MSKEPHCSQYIPESSNETDIMETSSGSPPKEKCHREVFFAFLPDKYKPLVDDEAREERKKKKEKLKKVKKLLLNANHMSVFLPYVDAPRIEPENVRRVLRSTWKCLKLGMYNFALGYSTPVTVAAAFVPDFHRNNT